MPPDGCESGFCSQFLSRCSTAWTASSRITRTTSKAGEYEHILDFFYENSWWLALGFFLSKSGSKFAWYAALLMVAFDLADNIVYSVADVKWHRSVDNATAFLSRFRLVAGQRNIYTWMFLPGFFLGVPVTRFYSAVAWAGVSGVYSRRLVHQ